MSKKKTQFTMVSSVELDELRQDRARLNALESCCWDVSFESHSNGMDGDYTIGIEIIGHYMGKPSRRVLGENYNENLRAAIDQALTAEAYPPERPEYDQYGNPERRRA
ncbi:hypothetical protein [Pantoea sp. Cy-639]|uniref:hypothetical protein n=1 Tax=Pantoea sp. Cy-639 TaxID=2608360 RepID=UPI001423C6C6|nr:hypothetical protein [Pantoea sp. Cy-639]NIF19872.1 hypothetical protein [Pantoea sp. Cy-639]